MLHKVHIILALRNTAFADSTYLLVISYSFFYEAPASSITERAPILPTVSYAVLALMNLNIAFVAS